MAKTLIERLKDPLGIKQHRKDKERLKKGFSELVETVEEMVGEENRDIKRGLKRVIAYTANPEKIKNVSSNIEMIEEAITEKNPAIPDLEAQLQKLDDDYAAAMNKIDEALAKATARREKQLIKKRQRRITDLYQDRIEKIMKPQA